MTKDEFSQLCRSHGLTMTADTQAVGWERGFFIVLRYAGKNNVSVSLPVRKDDQNKYARDLKLELKSRFGRNVSAAWTPEGVTMFVSSKSIPDVYCQGVTAALDTLRGLGFTAPENCPVCGRAGCDAAIPKGPGCVPVHRACLEGNVSGAQVRSDDNLKNGSYLLGFIGALLGMVVGILPTVLTILAMDRIYVLLFMFIPLASYAGYRLLKGKMNYAALIFSILFSILGVFLLNFISSLWAVKEYYSLTISQMMELAVPAFTDMEVWAEIAKSEDFLKCLIFVAAGIFLAWGQISRTGKTDVKAARDVLSSAVPYAAPQSFEYDPADYLPDDADRGSGVE